VPAFTQRFLFPAQTRVDHTQHAPRWAEIWLSLDDFLLLRACSGKSCPRFALIVCHARDKAFCKCTIEKDLVVEPNFLFAPRAQSSCCGSGVAFGKGASEPIQARRYCSGICGPN
jgi:hypothetical protein